MVVVVVDRLRKRENETMGKPVCVCVCVYGCKREERDGCDGVRHTRRVKRQKSASGCYEILSL